MQTETTSKQAEAPAGERKQEPAARRSNTPRVGSFITIAAALLMLFGAASRMGKDTETVPFFGIDRQAESRISNEIGRIQAALTIGTQPVVDDSSEHAVPINHNLLPPPRQEVDLDVARRRAIGDNRPSVSITVPDNRQDETDYLQSQFNGGTAQPLRPPAAGGLPQNQVAPVQPPAAPQPAHVESYTVESGDTWVKIAKRTLGDANRWRDIQNANPGSSNGLEVGMKLKIPR